MKTAYQINLLTYSILDMKDASSSGSADDGAILADGKKLDDLRNALESGKDQHQIDAMKKVIGYIAKGNIYIYTRSFWPLKY